MEAASKSTTSEWAIPSWDRLGEEGEPSWRWEILRGIPHLSNVTYFPLGERNTGIHLRLRVLSVISNRTLTCVIYPVRAFVLELLVLSSRLPHLVCIRLTLIFRKA